MLITVLCLLPAACQAEAAPAHTAFPSPSLTTSPRTTQAPSTPSTATPTGPQSSHPPPATSKPTPLVVIDPGHSRAITATDPITGLIDSDYENEPEMRDVFAVAELVRTQLEHAGYRVIMTKNAATDQVPLAQRAAIANAASANLALSIHDQAGSSGGIGFTAGNNIVYDQSVGGYRETPTGKRIVFTDQSIAALSAAYGRIFQAQRAAAQHATVRLQGDVGYDLGGRGLAPGNMWMVQLLADVPWVYNEAGGNSAGMVGLNAADQASYAAGLVAAVEQCVPIGA